MERLKAAAPARQEQSRSALSAARLAKADSRLHVEEAEDKLVQSTETAIGLMKAVLENVALIRLQHGS